MKTKKEPKKTGCVSFVDEEIQFTDPKLKAEFLSRLGKIQRYAKRQKKDIEELLEGRAQVDVIIRIGPAPES